MSDPVDTGGFAAIAMQQAHKAALKDYGLVEKPKALVDLDGMSVKELLELRNDIDVRLPTTSLKDFDLQQATLLHYYALRELQKTVAEDGDVPTNQKAQVANSVSSALKEITKMRMEIYNSEQFRLMEGALAKALKEQPEEFQKAFLQLYQKTAEDLANAGPGTTA